jgi:large subunit ribosomal protein L24
MKKIKKGDAVVIIAGKDKGKQGKVLSVQQDYVIVEGANQVKKHVRPNPQKGEQGGITEKAMPLHCSNVMLYDPNKQKGSRVGIRKLKDGELARYFKTSNELVDIKR